MGQPLDFIGYVLYHATMGTTRQTVFARVRRGQDGRHEEDFILMEQSPTRCTLSTCETEEELRRLVPGAVIEAPEGVCVEGGAPDGDDEETAPELVTVHIYEDVEFNAVVPEGVGLVIVSEDPDCPHEDGEKYTVRVWDSGRADEVEEEVMAVTRAEHTLMKPCVREGTGEDAGARVLLVVPERCPAMEASEYPAGIEPGAYTRFEVIDILRRVKGNPEAVQFVADMLEE